MPLGALSGNPAGYDNLGAAMKAIVTGHSRGLGAAIAAELLQRGVAVLGLARRPNASLQARFPQLLTQHAIDLADTSALLAWLETRAPADFLRGEDIIFLVNNAATVQPMGSLDKLPAATLAQALALNISAPLLLAGAVAAADAAQRRILHISSGAGRDAFDGWSAYCSAKAALDHHARAAALARRPGLRICSLAPGVFDTDMQAEIRATEDHLFPLRERFLELLRDGQLVGAAVGASRVVDFLMADDFGVAPTAALR